MVQKMVQKMVQSIFYSMPKFRRKSRKAINQVFRTRGKKKIFKFWLVYHASFCDRYMNISVVNVDQQQVRQCVIVLIPRKIIVVRNSVILIEFVI